MDDEIFLQQFEAALLPMEKWHHREHIKVAYLYLLRYPREQSMTRLREKIEALNVFHRVPDLPTRGYHETMTQAWLRLVDAALREHGPAETADLFLQRNQRLADKNTLLHYYSRDLLLSPQAKKGFAEPDLTPLPESRRERSVKR